MDDVLFLRGRCRRVGVRVGRHLGVEGVGVVRRGGLVGYAGRYLVRLLIRLAVCGAIGFACWRLWGDDVLRFLGVWL